MILNNYERSIANLAFWIENHELVSRLHAIENGEVLSGVSEKKEGKEVVRTAMFYCAPVAELGIDALLDQYFGIHNPKDYLKFYYRYVKTYCNEMGLDDNEYFLSLLEIKHLLTLPGNKYNVDAIVDTMRSGFAYVNEYRHDTELRKELFMSLIEDYAIKSVSFAQYINPVLAEYPDKVAAYRAGNANMLNMLFGAVIKSLPDRNVDKQTLSTELKSLLEL